MLPLVEFPLIVQHYAPWFERVFSEEALVQFQRYLSGLIISENKTVNGINRLFVMESRHQSSLNRLLTESPFSLAELNRQRVALLNSLEGTRLKPKGVLSVDDTLLTHYGQHFEHIASLYDPAEKRYTWAHDLINLHYSDEQTDYPIAFQLWRPADLEQIEQGLREAGIPLRESKLALKASQPKKWRQYLLSLWSRKQDQPAVAALYQSKLWIARQLLRQWVEEHPELKLPVTFDHGYTQPAFCRFLDRELHLPYVGTLAKDNEVVLKRGRLRLEAFAEHLKQEHYQAIQAGGQPIFHQIGIPYKGEKETYYSYCRTHLISNFGKQRLVINFSQADLSDSPRFYNSNRLIWQSAGITHIRRHRWPVEVYHQEGKQEGLDQYQVRDFQAISRHIGLVAVAYSLLRAAPHDEALLHKLQRQLELDLEGSPPFWRRATQAQSLWALAGFISAGLTQGLSLHKLMLPLLAAVCS
jgi:DDE superfamily endonuclease